MLGRKERRQPELFVAGSLRDLLPDDHILVRVARVLDLGWLHEEVAALYGASTGRPSIDPGRPSAEARGFPARLRPRPAADARGPGQPRNALVLRLWPARDPARPFEPDPDSPALGRPALPPDLRAHGTRLP